MYYQREIEEDEDEDGDEEDEEEIVKKNITIPGTREDREWSEMTKKIRE